MTRANASRKYLSSVTTVSRHGDEITEPLYHELTMTVKSISIDKSPPSRVNLIEIAYIKDYHPLEATTVMH